MKSKSSINMNSNKVFMQYHIIYKHCYYSIKTKFSKTSKNLKVTMKLALCHMRNYLSELRMEEVFAIY